MRKREIKVEVSPKRYQVPFGGHLVFVVFLFVFAGNLYAGELEDFKVALNKQIDILYRMENNPEFRKSGEFRKDLKSLSNFVRAYPKSKYSDDAYFLGHLFGFNHHLIYYEKYRDDYSKDQLVGFIKTMEEFVNLHFDQAIEQETINLLGKNQDKLRAFNAYPATIFIPYDKILYYMRGAMAFKNERYYKAREEFVFLKENIDLSWDSRGILGELIYTQLISVETAIDDIDAAEELINEAIKVYPDEEWPKEWLKLFKKKKWGFSFF